MTAAAEVVGAAVVALVAAAWAGLCALGEEAAATDEALRAPRRPRGARVIGLHRALHVARFALLTVAGVAAAAAVGWWLQPWPWAGLRLGIVVILVFVLGDAIPRSVAALAPDVARGGMEVARRTLPLLAPVLWLATRFDREARDDPGRGAAAGDDRGPEQQDMLLGVFSLAETTVAEVMTPRLDVVAVDVHDSPAEVLETFRRSEHARLPVDEGTPDNVVGVIYAKDLLPALFGLGEGDQRWQDLIRPPLFVPEAKTLEAQLRDFQRGPSHMAIVVDEYGGTAGLVTREDVLEEIVGEILDEYDVEEQPAIRQDGPDRFWVDGTVTLDDLSEALGARIEREDVATVGGLVLSVLGRVPRPGEELRLDGFRVVVEQVIRRRVKRVYFERLDETLLPPGEPVEEEGR